MEKVCSLRFFNLAVSCFIRYILLFIIFITKGKCLPCFHLLAELYCYGSVSSIFFVYKCPRQTICPALVSLVRPSCPDKSVTFVRLIRWEADIFFCATLVMPMSGAIIGVEVEIRPNAVSLRLQMCGQKPVIDN